MPRKKTDTGTDEKKKTGTGKRGRPKGTGHKNKGYTVSPAALAVRRANHMPARTDEERDFNARNIDHAMKTYEISLHADRNDMNSLRSCFAAYVQLCHDDGFKIGNIGAAMSIGLTYQALHAWFLGKAGQEKQELARFICSVCSLSRENSITEGKLNPIVGIFHQRNFDGLRNDTEQQQNNQITDPEEETSGKYLEKYSHLIEE